MTKVAFSTLGCPDWTWFDVLNRGPRLGYDGVEIRLLAREVDLLKVGDLRPQHLSRRRRELAEAGFAVCGLASSVRFDFEDDRQIDEQVEIGRAYIDLASRLGASFVRVFGDVLPADVDNATQQNALARIAQGLDRLGEFATQAGVDVLLETHGDFSSSQNVRDVMSLVQNPAVGVLWDTHHPWRFCGETLPGTFREIGAWVRHTHWKDSVTSSERSATEGDDAARQAHALMSGHRHADYVLFGEGEFPARECMRLLCAAGYDGWFSLEWEKMWHPQLAGPDVALPPFPDKIKELKAFAPRTPPD